MEEYEEPAPAPDTHPPLIILLGEAEIELRQGDVYTDEGATVYDDVDGWSLQVTVTGVEDVDTCCVTAPEAPFLITYAAADSAGNKATEFVRRVAVVSPCEPPSFFCAGLADVCAACVTSDTTVVTCLCFDTSLEVGEPVVLEEYTPPVDNTSPALLLLGEGSLGLTSSGALAMVHEVVQGTSWEDPGVEEHDDTDPGESLGARLGSFGNTAIDTSVQSRSGEPFVVTYTVTDAAGNAAQEVQRRIFVVNPCAGAGEGGRDERVCEGGLGAVQCSEAGLCLSVDYMEEETAEAEVEPPTISRIGPASVQVAEGATYAACVNPGMAVATVCDQGAEASDVLDGHLTPRVLACSPDGVLNRFANQGVHGCQVDTGVPGVYTVEYAVVNSAGAWSTARRNVTVAADCPLGELPCVGQVTCSHREVCLDELGTSLAERDLGLDEAAPPSLALVTTAAVPSSYVEVKQHAAYTKCAAGEEARVDVLCEPGAVAADAEGVDLSARVLACPPEACLATGCPGHEWTTKGLQGCVNTSAEVGTVFLVDFVVFDDAMPAKNATVTRTVGIIHPCDIGAGESLCSDLVCFMDCQYREQVLGEEPADTTAPVVTILPTLPARIAYGNASATASMRACTSVEDPGPCAALAHDAESGDVSGTFDTAVQDTACEGCSTTPCPLKQLHRCFPGLYGYLYEATDAAGNRGVATLLVEVVELASVTAQMVLSAAGMSWAEASSVAALLLESTSTEAVAFREAQAVVINAASSDHDVELTPSDIIIVSAEVRTESGEVIESETAAQGELSLLVGFDTAVAVRDALHSSRRRQRRQRRALVQAEEELAEGGDGGGGGALMSRSSEVAVILMEAASDGRTSTALAEASGDDSLLPTEVDGLAGETAVELLTLEVDEVEALEASIAAEIGELQGGSEQLVADVEKALRVVADAGGNPDEWLARVLREWLEALETEADNTEALLGATQELLVKLRVGDWNSSAPELLDQDRQVEAQSAVQSAVEKAEAQLAYISHYQSTQAPPPAMEPPTTGGCSMDMQGSRERTHSFTVSPAESTSTRRQLLAFLRGNSLQHSPSPIRTRKREPYRQQLADYSGYDDWELPRDVDDYAAIPTDSQKRYLNLQKNRLVGALKWEVDPRVISERCPLYTFLEEGYLVDKTATQIEATVTTWNSQMQAWSMVTLLWHRSSGPWQVDYEVFSSKVTYWNFREFDTFMWSLLHLAWICITWRMLHNSLMALRPSALSIRYPLTPSFMRQLYLHLSQLEPALDVAIALAQAAAAGFFVAYQVAILYLVEIDTAHDVYHDLYYSANFFLSARRSDAEDAGGLLEDAAVAAGVPPAWALPEDNAGLEGFSDDLVRVAWLGWLHHRGTAIQATFLGLLVLRFIVNTQHQPRLGLVFNTCMSTFYYMLQLIIMPISMMCFVTVFHTTLGPKNELFSTFFKTSRLVSELAFARYYKGARMRIEGWEMSRLEEINERFHIVAITSFSIFIITNLLFSVVCDYVLVHWLESRMAKSRTMTQDLEVLLVPYQRHFLKPNDIKWPAPERIIRVYSQVYHALTAAEQLKAWKLNPKSAPKVPESATPRITLSSLLSAKSRGEPVLEHAEREYKSTFEPKRRLLPPLHIEVLGKQLQAQDLGQQLDALQLYHEDRARKRPLNKLKDLDALGSRLSRMLTPRDDQDSETPQQAIELIRQEHHIEEWLLDFGSTDAGSMGGQRPGVKTGRRRSEARTKCVTQMLQQMQLIEDQQRQMQVKLHKLQKSMQKRKHQWPERLRGTYARSGRERRDPQKGWQLGVAVHADNMPDSHSMQRNASDIRYIDATCRERITRDLHDSNSLQMQGDRSNRKRNQQGSSDGHDQLDHAGMDLVIKDLSKWKVDASNHPSNKSQLTSLATAGASPVPKSMGAQQLHVVDLSKSKIGRKDKASYKAQLASLMSDDTVRVDPPTGTVMHVVDLADLESDTHPCPLFRTNAAVRGGRNEDSPSTSIEQKNSMIQIPKDIPTAPTTRSLGIFSQGALSPFRSPMDVDNKNLMDMRGNVWFS
ncbi:hypothetical protein CYMTET_56767 [Cymbomonas tetramitiformis]|uniref:Pesticidal crystal protein Cry22Aa Ig-like domain-containing protein n=1 Tax=Cymbomonas tetramitiformis TaxID=36881 RepID=A0AAE0BBJ0_9CHLO|nr:hypothetical protein CYMTET_56767 [Cymbomonas tetramitiformis]